MHTLHVWPLLGYINYIICIIDPRLTKVGDIGYNRHQLNCIENIIIFINVSKHFQLSGIVHCLGDI